MNNKYQYPPICLAWAGPIIFAGLLLFGGNPVYADRYVAPTNTGSGPDYDSWTKAATNIQDAVNVAVDGETVWVSNGIYRCSGVTNCVFDYGGVIVTNEAMVIITNAITLKSWSGNYNNTVINGNYPAWTTRVAMVINTGAVLDGLTITNGVIHTNYNAVGGAGVFFRGNLMTNCLITGNIISNSVTSYEGVGVLIETGVVSHCTIAGNKYPLGSSTARNGVGMTVRSGGPGPRIVTNCVFTRNGRDDWNGGPAACYIIASCTIANCRFYNNNQAYGIQIYSASGVQILSCVISNCNFGGIYLAETGSSDYNLIKNCLITHNNSYGIGASYRAAKGLTRIENCTIAHNRYEGIYVSAHTSTNTLVVNSIIYNNFGGTNWGCYLGTNAVYSNCCIIPMPTNLPGLPEGTGNITNAPMYVNTNVANYRLSSQSPCINTGANRDWMTNGADLDGRRRIDRLSGRVDMGAYERISSGTILIGR